MKNFLLVHSDEEESVVNKFDKIREMEEHDLDVRVDAMLKASKDSFLQTTKYRCHSEERFTLEDLLGYHKNLKLLKKFKTKVDFSSLALLNHALLLRNLL